jgi:hypothetical protein
MVLQEIMSAHVLFTNSIHFASNGFANNSLSVVSYRHFHETYSSLEVLLETCIISALDVMVGF